MKESLEKVTSLCRNGEAVHCIAGSRYLGNSQEESFQEIGLTEIVWRKPSRRLTLMYRMIFAVHGCLAAVYATMM